MPDRLEGSHESWSGQHHAVALLWSGTPQHAEPDLGEEGTVDWWRPLQEQLGKGLTSDSVGGIPVQEYKTRQPQLK